MILSTNHTAQVTVRNVIATGEANPVEANAVVRQSPARRLFGGLATAPVYYNKLLPRTSVALDAYTNKGTWSSSTAYAVGDVAYYSSAWWYGTTASTGQAPSFSSTSWKPFDSMSTVNPVPVHDRRSKKLLSGGSREVPVIARTGLTRPSSASATATVIGTSLTLMTNDPPAVSQIRFPVVVGEFVTVLLLQGDKDGTILNHSYLNGLRVSPDRTRIHGVIAFTEPKLFNVTTSTGKTFVIEIVPGLLKRLM